MKKNHLLFFVVLVAAFNSNLLFAQTTLKYRTLDESIPKSKELMHTTKDVVLEEVVHVENGMFTIGGIPENISTSPYMFMVDGAATMTRVEVKAELWADFVFEDSYNLKSLEEVEKFIMENKHLPDVPSESEVKANKLDLASMDATLLQKIEELTLYIIEQEKRIQALEQSLLEK